MAACALAALCAMPVRAEEESDRYHKVEAAFLYNFFNYITWPGLNTPQELKAATICIAANDPIEPYLRYIQSKMADERSLNIQSGEQDLQACNLVFTRHRLTEGMRGKLSSATLVVIAPQDTLDRGDGMIELDRDEMEIHMRINQQWLAENGFKVSSRLLALAMK